MGMIKNALLTLVDHIYPDDFDAQDDLQDRILDGQGLTTAEMKLAKGCEIGRAFINAGQIREAGVC